MHQFELFGFELGCQLVSMLHSGTFFPELNQIVDVLNFKRQRVQLGLRISLLASGMDLGATFRHHEIRCNPNLSVHRVRL